MGQHFSDYLKTHDRTKDLSSAEFGRLVGISKSAAADILAGRATPPPGTLRKIANAFPDIALAELEELALLDTPFVLQEGAQLLSLEERAFVRSAVDQLLKSSGKAARVQNLKPGELERLRRLAQGNVVNLHPTQERVQKAAYNPPPDDE